VTYADQLMANKYALIATQIGHKKRKDAIWMHRAAQLLWAMDKEKPKTDEHLRQLAAEWA
jgi:hypothetical protein